MAHKIERAVLAQRIRELDGLTNDERSALLELLNTKKFGLVWEDKPEDVEERLRENLPVLKEVKEKALTQGGADAPNHIIIEGDNLEALTALTYTHEGKIDVIYIDPPYNTGNKDFVYNDNYVDAEDGYRHSKWLSFMNRRLKIAKRLLSDKGVIFISIDDNEQANLKLLCDEVFGCDNSIATLPVVMNLKGNQDEFAFAGTHEYALVYCKAKSIAKFNCFDIDEEDMEEWQQDEIGYYKKGATLKRTGEDAPREKRPYGYFPILIDIKTNVVSVVQEDEYRMIYDKDTRSFDDVYIEELASMYRKKGFEVLLPTNGNIKTSWRWGFLTVKKYKEEIIVIHGRDGVALYKKQRPNLGELPTKKPKSVFYKAQYSSGNGTQQLLNILLGKRFSNPKPIDLIADFLTIGTQANSLILDFFAGSGTTLHATMQLNEEDKGHRQCILVTNNENNICEEVTYERNKRVINGYTTPKGVAVEGLHGNNLRYYRTEFIPRERTNTNMRALVKAATDLLCIKEDLYDEEKTLGSIRLKPSLARLFRKGNQQMLVIYREEVILRIVEELEKLDFKEKLKVYLFAPGRYAFDDDFITVQDKVSLCALPAAIYDAYQKVLPKRKVKLLPEYEPQQNDELNFEEGRSEQ